MTVNKRKKATRYRGSQTHGGGAKKKRRGAGNRGGRGMAGSGKRADSKKPSLWSNPYFGKRGFTSKSQTPKAAAINLGMLEQSLPSLIGKKLASQEKDVVVIDLEKAGYTKLLGEGQVKTKFRITVSSASKSAQQKVAEAGGEILGLQASDDATK